MTFAFSLFTAVIYLEDQLLCRTEKQRARREWLRPDTNQPPSDLTGPPDQRTTAAGR